MRLRVPTFASVSQRIVIVVHFRFSCEHRNGRRDIMLANSREAQKSVEEMNKMQIEQDLV